MNKEIVYLVQTSDYIPDFVRTLEKMGRDIYLLSYKKPVSHKNSTFLFDCALSEGRNKLAEIVPKDYLYYVFLDDDLELLIRKDKYPNNRYPWDIYENFLLEYMPAIGTASCDNSSYGGFVSYLDDSREVNTVKEYECIISGLHKDTLELCFPIFEGFNKVTWYWTGGTLLLTRMLAFYPYILQCNKLIIHNRLHRHHKKYKRIVDFNFLHKMFQDSLLFEVDKKEAYVSWDNRFSEREYKKPDLDKYKKMVKEFKNKVDKKHFLWKDHPFINE